MRTAIVIWIIICLLGAAFNLGQFCAFSKAKRFVERLKIESDG
jgi:hypothetical protein